MQLRLVPEPEHPDRRAEREEAPWLGQSLPVRRSRSPNSHRQKNDTAMPACRDHAVIAASQSIDVLYRRRTASDQACEIFSSLVLNQLFNPSIR